MADWNPSQYMAFGKERAQPALDLIARFYDLAPRKVVDLGCGPGNSTAMLRSRFPEADLTGLDSSPAMIERAKGTVPDAAFALADVADWLPDPDTDLVFSNALFQWVPDHPAVLRRIFQSLKPSAVLAVQMPDNLTEPCHAMMRDVANRERWRGYMGKALEGRSGLLTASGYHDLLQPLAERLEIWRTTYHHPLAGHQGIIGMLSSTGLKPFLEALDEESRPVFLDDYRQALAKHYLFTADGKVLLAFPRLFILASRAGS